MKVIEIKDFLNNEEEYLILTVEELKRRLDELEINGIKLGGKDIIRCKDEKIVHILYNDYEHPIVIKKDNILKSNTLYINQEWYLDNQEVCQELFNYICANMKVQDFFVGSSLIINNELVDSLCSNKNLKTISLAKFGDNPYSLTKEDYLKFKDSTINLVDTKLVDDELKDNFDGLIGLNKKRHLIAYYNYDTLQKTSGLYLTNQLTEEEIYNLKYVPMGVEIKFVNDSYKNIDKVIGRLNELSKYNKLVIDIKDKEKFNMFLLNKNIEYDNLYIILGLSEYNIKDYLRFEKKLYEMISGAKNLSPFEKYIYAYNVTKRFKKYKENNEDLGAARNLYSILINDYMVCVGFSNMFGDLLNKLGISNSNLSVAVDVSYDSEKVDEENFEVVKEVEYGGHSRRYVHIVDEKYGIDGFYVADPTWDNDLEKDYYNNLAMTNKEVLDGKRYLKNNIDDSSELFFVDSIEEYIEKINFLLSRNNMDNKLKDIIHDLVNNKISKIDGGYVEKLKSKYTFLKESTNSWPDDINDLVYELGNYIVNHVNKEISGGIIIEAVSNVYRNAYGYSGEQLDSKMIEIINDNKECQEKSFPTRYNVKEDGTREVIIDIKNKFDIEYSGRSR